MHHLFLTEVCLHTRVVTIAFDNRSVDSVVWRLESKVRRESKAILNKRTEESSLVLLKRSHCVCASRESKSVIKCHSEDHDYRRKGYEE